MKLQVKFETIEDIKKFRSNLQTIKLQLLEFQATTIRKLGDGIIQRIHVKMKAAGFSQKIIDGTFLDNIEIMGTKRVRLFFRSIYFTSAGFDVALAREEGTKKHKVVAGEGKVLPIPTSNGIIFRKSANPDGILALFIVRNTVREMKESFQDEYNRQLVNWYASNLGGKVIAS